MYLTVNETQLIQFHLLLGKCSRFHLYLWPCPFLCVYVCVCACVCVSVSVCICLCYNREHRLYLSENKKMLISLKVLIFAIERRKKFETFISLKLWEIAQKSSEDVCTFWNLPSNGIIAKVELHDLEVLLEVNIWTVNMFETVKAWWTLS